eukprot:gnl/Dysnectes_brevis/5586_a8101_456.p1 GENE.gnl/Dysnectes_brevis/5586_a8101_456~~gnl/Dysnectes_brevis/5586_a8101_456.p1  ORF type:complete len:482 (+),score=176.61 gnl/Dysnectes_brevis/5586_a8101_456:46-1446(+)
MSLPPSSFEAPVSFPVPDLTGPVPKFVKKRRALYDHFVTPSFPPISPEQMAELERFKAYVLENPTFGPEYDLHDKINLRFLKLAKGDLKKARNLLLQSQHFRRSLNVDNLTIWDVEPILTEGFSAALSDYRDASGRNIFYFSYHFPGGLSDPKTVLNIVVAFVYLCKIVEELMDETNQPPLMIMDCAEMTTKDFDPRLEKSLVRIYEEIFPNSFGPCLCPGAKLWLRVAIRLFSPWIPEGMYFALEKKRELTDFIVPPQAMPKPFGSGADVQQFIAWRKSVEPRPEVPHRIEDAVLKSWNIKASKPAHKQEDVILKGFGWKRTKAGRKWTKYYFTLDDGICFYYKKKTSTVSNNGLMLEEGRVHTKEEDMAMAKRARVTKFPHDRVLVLATVDREYFFAFPTVEETETWRREIAKEITRRQEVTGISFGAGPIARAADLGVDVLDDDEIAQLEREEEEAAEEVIEE